MAAAKSQPKALKLDLSAPSRVLLDAIDAVIPACGQQSGMPILSTLLVSASQSGKVTISGADLTVTCAASLVCPVRVAGAVCLPAKLFRDIVAKMGDGVIAITYDGSSTTITGPGKRKASAIASVPGEEFVSVPTPQGEPVTISAAALASVLRMTRASMSTDTTRPHLAATMLTLSDGVLRAVSTDGHRMTVAPAKIEGARDIPGVLVPRTFLDRAKVPTEGEVQIWPPQKDAPLFMRRGDVTWSTKLVDAAFPSYEQVIPTSWDMTVTCDRAALMDAVAAVSLVASDRTAGVRLRVDGTSNGRIEITSQNPERGEMADEIPCDVVGERREIFIGFNGRYILDTMSVLASDRVTIRFIGDLDPARIEDAEIEGFMGLWMPMRIVEG